MTDSDLTPEDAGKLDLTPREPTATGGSGRSAGLRNGLIVAGIALILGFVLYQALTSARVFFYNVDEAVARRAELVDQTIRMQGTVVADNGLDTNGALLFTVAFDEATAEVRHVGDEPSGLFEQGEKVLVEGRWEGEVFESHQVLVKHSEEYVEDNPDRLEYELDPASVE